MTSRLLGLGLALVLVATAQLTTIQGTDTLTGSRTVINNNFAWLNNNKIPIPAGSGIIFWNGTAALNITGPASECIRADGTTGPCGDAEGEPGYTPPTIATTAIVKCQGEQPYSGVEYSTATAPTFSCLPGANQEQAVAIFPEAGTARIIDELFIPATATAIDLAFGWQTGSVLTGDKAPQLEWSCTAPGGSTDVGFSGPSVLATIVPVSASTVTWTTWSAVIPAATCKGTLVRARITVVGNHVSDTASGDLYARNIIWTITHAQPE